MGKVYLAQHPRLPRRDALKVLPASVSRDDEYRARFEREADIAATLAQHPHIVGVHDRGEFNGQLWIAMDYVDGTDAAELLTSYPHGLPAAPGPRHRHRWAGRWTTRINASCCATSNTVQLHPDGPSGIRRAADLVVGGLRYAAHRRFSGADGI